MAKKTKKLTTFKSSESVVTEKYMNSIYGGLHGTEKESLYNTTDPLIGGHVHDGEHADGHAQKINLGQHVTGLLPQALIEGTLDSASPGSPLNSIQFNSGDTFAGTPSFLFQNSTDNLQFSKDKRFYYGSIDNQNSYYISHEINSDPDLIFGSESTADSINYRFRNATSDTTDVLIEFAPSAENVYLYGESSVSRRFYLGNVSRSFNPWYLLYSKGVRLYHQAETLNQKHVTLAVGTDQVNDYSLLFPIYNTASSNMVLKTVTSGSTIKLTWDTYSSGGGSSYFEGQNMNITVNNTIETESSVLFNTVESDTYYVGETDAFIKGDDSALTSLINFGVNGTTEMVLDSQKLYSYADQGLGLGDSSNRFSSLHVDNIVIDTVEVKSVNSKDLILKANDGTNGSIISLEYSADNTTDVTIQTNGKGYLKSPYKNVMSEGHDGGLDSRTTFINTKATCRVQGNYSGDSNPLGRIVMPLGLIIGTVTTYASINLDIVASIIDKSGTVDLCRDTAFAKQHYVVSRPNENFGFTYQKTTPSTTLDSTTTHFASANSQISSINVGEPIVAAVPGAINGLTIGLSVITIGAIDETPFTCDFLVTAKVTHIPGIDVFRN